MSPLLQSYQRAQSARAMEISPAQRRRNRLALHELIDGKMPCTAKTKRCANAREYDHELRPCCRAHIRQMMDDLGILMNSAGITWWADYGTLLGAVRNPRTTWADYPWLPQDGRDTEGPPPGIIPHDKDADLGLLWKDWRKLIRVKDHLLRLGYDVRVNSYAGSMKLRLSRVNHTNIDMFVWHERADGTLYRRQYARVDACKGKEFRKEDILPLTTVRWEEMTLPAPHDPDAFLAMRYGPNWRTPIPANHDGVKR